MITRYYVDVSGKESNRGERAITAAGYIASPEQWDQFEEVWTHVLAEAKADYFHATEFFACSGPFRWLKNDPAEHWRLTALFALAPYMVLPGGYSSSLDLDHFNPILTRALKSLRTPHERIPAAMIAVAEVCNQVANKALPPKGPRAEMYIEEGDGVGEIVEWLRHLKRIGEPWTGAFVSFDVVSGKKHSVQAADYLAHETWHEATLMMRNPNRTWDDIKRAQFKLLTTGPDMVPPEWGTAKVDVRYATQEHFERSAPQLAAFIVEHPEYQRPPWHRGWRKRVFGKRARKAATKQIRRRLKGWARRTWYGYLGQRPRKPNGKR